MFEIGLNEWNGIKVLVIDYTLETNPHLRHAFMVSGIDAPLAAIRMHSSSRAGFEAAMADAESDHIKGLADLIPWDEQYIGICWPVVKDMSEEHITALLHHEKAHIDNGDLLSFGDTPGLLTVDEFELRADRAGVDAVGREVYLDALLTVIERMARAASQAMDMPYSEVFSKLIKNPSITERIIALQ